MQAVDDPRIAVAVYPDHGEAGAASALLAPASLGIGIAKTFQRYPGQASVTA